MDGQPRVIRRLKVAYLAILPVLLPVVSPQLPGNTTIFDFVNVAFIGVFMSYMLLTRRLETRLGGVLGLIFFASLISMLNTRNLGTNMLTVLQELYLYIFFLTLYNIIDSQEDVRLVGRVWLLCAAVEGAILLSQLLADLKIRALGTFLNPNMAASYMGISLFTVLLVSGGPRRLLKLACWLLVLAGMVATKSMSALLSFGVPGTILFAGYWLRAGVSRKAKLALGALVVLAIVAAVSPQLLGIKNYGDRMDKSAGGRVLLWQAGLNSFLENPLGIGIGPAGFEQVGGLITGGEFGTGRRKELHSDYLSFLAERGILGFTGLVLFIASFYMILWRSVWWSYPWDRLFLSVLGLGGMFMFMWIDSVTHEILHYRHVWLAFGLMASQERLLRKNRQERSRAAWAAERGDGSGSSRETVGALARSS